MAGLGPCASLPQFGVEGKGVNLPGAAWLRAPFHLSLIDIPSPLKIAAILRREDTHATLIHRERGCCDAASRLGV